MTVEEEIKVAEAALEAAREVAADLANKLDALYVRRSTEKFGIRIGMRVRETRRNARECIVTEIRPDSWGANKPWLSGKLIKKDGTPGEKTIKVFGDWEIVET